MDYSLNGEGGRWYGYCGSCYAVGGRWYTHGHFDHFDHFEGGQSEITCFGVEGKIALS